MAPKSPPFKVIIVGGGVAGLAMANMLEKFDLDYTLLESHQEIDCPTGAGIGLMPNGCLLLDQLGLYEAVQAAAESGEVKNSHIRSSDGKPIISLQYMMYHQEKRHGYPMLFFDRRVFLKVLYDQLKHKDRILLNSKVDTIDPNAGGVKVTTTNGQVYTGDFVIGADGIHSNVRHQMRRIAEVADPTYFESDEEDKVPCYYKCSFGIAQDVEGWPTGEQGFTTGNGKSFLVVSGPGGRCYWFLFVRLPEVKYGKEIPRYSSEDEAQFIKENLHLKIRENLTFAQVYAKRITSVLTPLHEVVYKKWFFDRIFLMGDAAHKPNPIGGMGANAAIETAAELMNALQDVRVQRPDGLKNLTTSDFTGIFKKVQDVRYERAGFTISSSHELQAFNAHEDPVLATLVWRVLVPLAGSHNFFRELSNRIVGAARLRYLELPKRAHALPYDYELPAKPLAPIAQRFVWALFSVGMIAMIYTAQHAMNISLDDLNSWGDLAPLSRNWLGDNTPNAILNVLTSLLSYPTLDVAVAPRVQLIYFLTHMISPLLIYTVEGYRLGRYGSLLSLPVIFMVGMQVQGLCKFAPLYVFVSLLHSGINPVDRTVRSEVARSLLPALILGFVLPVILMIAPTPDQSRWQDWGALFQVSPPLFSFLVMAMSSVLKSWRGMTRSSKSSEDADKHPEWYSTEDVPLLKSAYEFAFLVQATVHIATVAYAYSNPDLSISEVFFNLPNPFAAEWDVSSLYERVFLILKFDLLFSVAAFALHNIYTVWELRCQGYISTMKALQAGLLVVIGQALVGSGATWAGLWSWREDVISQLSVSEGGNPSS